jgi:hypothetical protein
MSESESDSVLKDNELCLYFESLSSDRQAIVWTRCERALGRAIDDSNFYDHELDEVWEKVLTDMWCADHLRRLVEFGRLRAQSNGVGKLIYLST